VVVVVVVVVVYREEEVAPQVAMTAMLAQTTCASMKCVLTRLYRRLPPAMTINAVRPSPALRTAATNAMVRESASANP
jgi:type II secretory pathway component PulM